VGDARPGGEASGHRRLPHQNSRNFRSWINPVRRLGLPRRRCGVRPWIRWLWGGGLVAGRWSGRRRIVRRCTLRRCWRWRSRMVRRVRRQASGAVVSVKFCKIGWVTCSVCLGYVGR